MWGRRDVGRGRFFADQTYHFQTLRVWNDIAADGDDTSEVLQTIKRIRSGDAQGWFQAWSQTGDRVVRRAGAAIDRLSKGRALLRAHNYYGTAEFLLPSEDPKRPVAGLGSSPWAATSGCVLRISTKLRDVVRRLLVGATVSSARRFRRPRSHRSLQDQEAETRIWVSAVNPLIPLKIPLQVPLLFRCKFRCRGAGQSP